MGKYRDDAGALKALVQPGRVHRDVYTDPEVFQLEMERLWARTRFFKRGLEERGFDTGASETPITPVIAGEDRAAQDLSRTLFDEAYREHARRIARAIGQQGGA